MNENNLLDPIERKKERRKERKREREMIQRKHHVRVK
jgi:hypothetical protein